MVIRLAVVAFLCLALFNVEARILETQHVEEILPLIDEETWLLVDLDNCMFQGAQALGHANWFYDELDQRMEKGMSREEAITDAYPDWIKTQKACRVTPLESQFIPSLLVLQNKGIPVMGLTHRQPSIADSTIKQVSSLGFDFLATAPLRIAFLYHLKRLLYTSKVFYLSETIIRKLIFLSPFSRLLRKILKKLSLLMTKEKMLKSLKSFLNTASNIRVFITLLLNVQNPFTTEKLQNFNISF